jgi:hypothetical protein
LPNDVRQHERGAAVEVQGREVRIQGDVEKGIEQRDARVVDEETDLVGARPLLGSCREARPSEVTDECARIDAMFYSELFGERFRFAGFPVDQ